MRRKIVIIGLYVLMNCLRIAAAEGVGSLSTTGVITEGNTLNTISDLFKLHILSLSQDGSVTYEQYDEEVTKLNGIMKESWEQQCKGDDSQERIAAFRLSQEHHVERDDGMQKIFLSLLQVSNVKYSQVEFDRLSGLPQNELDEVIKNALLSFHNNEIRNKWFLEADELYKKAIEGDSGAVCVGRIKQDQFNLWCLWYQNCYLQQLIAMQMQANAMQESLIEEKKQEIQRQKDTITALTEAEDYQKKRAIKAEDIYQSQQKDMMRLLNEKRNIGIQKQLTDQRIERLNNELSNNRISNNSMFFRHKIVHLLLTAIICLFIADKYYNIDAIVYSLWS